MARSSRRTCRGGIPSRRSLTTCWFTVHFYNGKADAVQYLNWLSRPKAFTGVEIDSLLKQSADGRWNLVDDGAEASMYVVKGFTAIHMKLDHILVVASDGYLERGIVAQSEAEAAKVKGL